jgi:putative ABC transport system substrate-binding protein
LDRRAFIGTLGGSILAARLTANAQLPFPNALVGFFYIGSRHSSLSTGRYAAFLEGMRELGYVEGKNLVVEGRFGDSKPEILPGLAADLVRSKVDVIVATGSPTYRVLQQMPPTVPIVITVTFDPVIEGLAASMARPGGNVTGLADTPADLGPKQLGLLKEVLPKLGRVGALLNPDNISHPAQITRLMLAAQKLAVRVVLAEAGTAADIDSGLASLARERAEAIILFGDTFFAQQFQQIAQAARNHREPSIYITHEYAEAGGLMSYGANITDNFRRVATFVDKILKGAKPADLPFEQPTRLYLVINLKTAKALGLTIPPSLLQRADQLIE